jgi:hypothetical protein
LEFSETIADFEVPGKIRDRGSAVAGQAISDSRGFLIVASVRIDLEAGFSRGRMRV